MNPRAAERLAANALDALRATIGAVGDGHPADQTLFSLFRSNPHWGSRDRRFTSQLVFSFFRWRGWLAELELHLAAAFAYSLDADEPHAAQTSLAGREMPVWGKRSIAEKMSALAEATGRTLAMEMLVPAWFSEAVAGGDDPGGRLQTNRLIESFQTRPPTWIRAVEGHAEEVFAALQARKLHPRRHEKMANAIACEGGVNLPEIRKAIGPVFEVQDIASQAVGHICDPKPGERWWDVCAGSGGKSLHLADLMRGRGEIIATDIRASALEQLAQRANKSGHRTIRAMPPGKNPDGLFDGVLVDAPCSGIGTWSRNPDMRWRTHEQTVDHFAKEQIEILLRAASAVKPGGTLVFAVCTITRAETSAIVAAFLAARTGFIPWPVNNPLADGRLLTSDLLLLPADGPGDGMFIAKFSRR